MKPQGRVWFFDLDGTLYDPRQGLWPAVGARIEAYLQQTLGLSPAAARALRRRYVQQYGTTLHGLRAEHPDLDPHDYLRFVGQVPVEALVRPDPRLRAVLATLPGPKWIFTNGDAPYARRVLRTLGVEDLFDGIIDIVRLNFVGKPYPAAYARALRLARGVSPAAALLVDDSRGHVEAARRAGWQAVWVHPEVRAPQPGVIPHIYALPQGLPQENTP